MEAGLTWSTWKKRKDIPPTAVCAGKDRDGSPIYVARAKHDGDLLPGKVIASSHMAYVPYEGKEICLDNFEVLTGTDFTWVASSNGLVPTGAFVAGKTASGKPLYVGRTDYNGSVVPGKIVSSHGCLYISFDGIEHSFKTYQVLVGYSWIPTTIKDKSTLSDGVYVGKGQDGSSIYVARGYHAGDVLPGKVIPSKKAAYFPYEGKEISLKKFEVLIGTGFSWIACANGSVPNGALIVGKTAYRDPLYLGRTLYNGTLTLGSVHGSHGCLYISFNGVKHPIKTYEVLVREYESDESSDVLQKTNKMPNCVGEASSNCTQSMAEEISNMQSTLPDVKETHSRTTQWYVGVNFFDVFKISRDTTRASVRKNKVRDMVDERQVGHKASSRKFSLFKRS